MSPPVLVAGVGNIFRGDDGFGCAAARVLATELPAERARVVDYGIRGLHLAYDLLDGYAALILLDALPGDQTPGTVRVLEVGQQHLESATGIDAHSMHPATVLAHVEALGGILPQTFVVGCVPESSAESIGLSATVSRSVSTAVAAVHDLLNHELSVTAARKPTAQQVETEK